MNKLRILNTQKRKKFGEICAFVARELGLPEWPAHDGDVRQQIEREARQYVKEWEETVEMRTDPRLRPATPLRRLLGQYHEICERILDEQDIEIGLWAYRRSPRCKDAAASR